VDADGAHVRLVVRDAGPGVPDDALPRLFDRLYRVAPDRNRGSGGAGLGLAICRSIVEAHGGTIAARRSATGGLEIEVRLPRETA
jgi:two-component system sensor histidine kinase BaeS